MEFEDHNENSQEGDLELGPSYNNSTRPIQIKMPVPLDMEASTPPPPPLRKSRYKECQKNHAVGIGAHAVDGCGEFIASGEDGTLESLKCAACNCHRNFHRKETEHHGSAFAFHQHPQQHQLLLQHPQGQYFGYRTPSGYLHQHHQQQTRAGGLLALPSSSGGGGSGEDLEENYYSNPSSSGGMGMGKKRFRTKFTQEQKEKMLNFAEGLGWRIQKQDEESVAGFCNEMGIKRHVLKVWMHNNKHTLGKKNTPTPTTPITTTTT